MTGTSRAGFVRSRYSDGWIWESDLSEAQAKPLSVRLEREYREWKGGYPAHDGERDTVRPPF